MSLGKPMKFAGLQASLEIEKSFGISSVILAGHLKTQVKFRSRIWVAGFSALGQDNWLDIFECLKMIDIENTILSIYMNYIHGSSSGGCDVEIEDRKII